jgi:hypothetical protein
VIAVQRPSWHTNSPNPLSRNLAATRAIEDTPHKEIIAELFKSVLGPGRHEKKVA